MQECLEKCRNIRTKNRTLVFILAMTVEIVFFKAQNYGIFKFQPKRSPFSKWMFPKIGVLPNHPFQ